MARTRFLLATVACAALSAAVGSAAPRSNIVFVLTDDMRRDDLEYMPLTQDQLVAEGAEFTAFVANVPLCCPARATLLRGQYSHNTRVLTNRTQHAFSAFRRSGHEKQTIATALQAAGYATGFFGKYLNGYPEGLGNYVPPGWNDWAALYAGKGYRGFGYTLLERLQHPTLGQAFFLPVYYGRARESYATDVLVRKASTFITESVDAGTPFFALLSMFAPHRPAAPAPRHKHLLPSLQYPRGPSFAESDLADKPRYMSKLKPLSRKTLRKIDRLHRRRVQTLLAVDEGVASLIALVDGLGQLDNTYFFFSSDNGFHLGEHRMKPGKRTPYEEDILLPLVVRGPGIPRGVTIEALAGNTDLAPTFAELAGTALAYDPDGRSLLPWLHEAGGPDAWRRSFLIDLWPGTNNKEEKQVVPAWHGVRTQTHVYVEYQGGGERELYDLERDPHQLDNRVRVADTDLLDAFSRRLAELGGCRGQGCRDLEDLPID